LDVGFNPTFNPFFNPPSPPHIAKRLPSTPYSIPPLSSFTLYPHMYSLNNISHISRLAYKLPRSTEFFFLDSQSLPSGAKPSNPTPKVRAPTSRCNTIRLNLFLFFLCTILSAFLCNCATCFYVSLVPPLRERSRSRPPKVSYLPRPNSPSLKHLPFNRQPELEATPLLPSDRALVLSLDSFFDFDLLAVGVLCF